MTRIDETLLPGVGHRYEFTTQRGTRVGVIAHYDGRRELVVYDGRDPDEARAVVELDPDDAHVLADLLGGTEVIEHLERYGER
jgi:TrkA domain protein